MSTDSGFLIMLFIPVLAGLISIGCYVLAGVLDFLRDLFNG